MIEIPLDVCGHYSSHKDFEISLYFFSLNFVAYSIQEKRTRVALYREKGEHNFPNKTVSLITV